MSRVTSCVALAAALALSIPAASGTAVSSELIHVGPGDSIQAAVDVAAPGDTIRVTGRHHENVVVQTDGLTLIGHGAVVVPPAEPAAHACYDPTVADEAVHGICVWGDIDADTGEVARYVEDVSVRGFTIRGFAGTGLVAVAAKRPTFAGNTLRNNRDSGINTTNSLDTRVWANRSSGNEFGLFSSQSEDTRIAGNKISRNCVGIALLATTATRIAANRIARNTRMCPAADDFPDLSGVGIMMVSSTHTEVVANAIVGNRSSGASAFVGGVVLAEKSSNSLIRRNTVLRNDPDLAWDETGTRNVLRHNRCATSVPSGLCG